MNQLERANAIAQDLQIGAYDADRFLKAAIAKIKATVTTNQPVELMELGTFTMRPNAPRVGRNPSTGAAIDIPARWSVSFKIDKAFKQIVEAVPLDNQAPGISMVTADRILAQTDKPYTFLVEYYDTGVGVLTSTIGRDEMKPDNLDIRVIGPNSYSQKAKAIETKRNGQKIAVTSQLVRLVVYGMQRRMVSMQLNYLPDKLLMLTVMRSNQVHSPCLSAMCLALGHHHLTLAKLSCVNPLRLRR